MVNYNVLVLLHDEYRKNIEKDAALERRSQPVQVDEPSVVDTVAILKGLRRSTEAHHRINIQTKLLKQLLN